MGGASSRLWSLGEDLHGQVEGPRSRGNPDSEAGLGLVTRDGHWAGLDTADMRGAF